MKTGIARITASTISGGIRIARILKTPCDMEQRNYRPVLKASPTIDPS
jgi:hypothetical protein